MSLISRNPIIIPSGSPMQIIEEYRDFPAAQRGGVVAIGNFDGVHRGHQGVIGAARALARQHGLPLGVLTFEPHPRAFLARDAAPFRLTPSRAKLGKLAAQGCDFALSQRFTAGLAAMSAEDFIEAVLIEALAVRHVVVGHDFNFGRARAGNAALLADWGARHGFAVCRITPRRDDLGEVISSSAIRALLAAGDVAGAAALLGHHWETEGTARREDDRLLLEGGELLPLAEGLYQVSLRAGKAGWSDALAQVSHGAGGWRAALFNFDPAVAFSHPELVVQWRAPLGFHAAIPAAASLVSTI